MTKTNMYSGNDKELAVAVCTRTYYKLNGHMPSIEELCMQLGKSYHELIRQMFERPAFVNACCA